MSTHECESCCGLGYIESYCGACNGSGEGMADGTRCRSCKGSGCEGVECPDCEGSGEILDEEEF